jgi:hypothetical protein
MNAKSRIVLAISALLICVAFGYTMFTDVRKGQDLYAYALSLVALLFAALSAIVLYPLRGNIFHADLLCDCGIGIYLLGD